MQSQAVKKLHCLPSDPNVRKEWMNFIFNELTDRVNKNLFLFSHHFTADSFTNKAQLVSERLKLKDEADYYIGSDSNVATQV